MPSRGRYLWPIALSILLVAISAKLLLTTVILPKGAPEPRWERGWPWVYQVFSGSEESPGLFTDLLDNEVRLSVSTSLIDLGLLASGSAIFVFLFHRYMRRRGFAPKFSLRGLLIFVAFCGGIFGWWAHVYSDWKLEERVMDQTQQDQSTWKFASCGPEWLRRLVPNNDPDIFLRLSDFFVDSSRQIDEQELASALQTLRWVRTISFSDRSGKKLRISNPDAFSRIEEISVSMAVDDESLKQLSQLTSLRYLDIDNERAHTVIPITDEGISQLANCKNLEYLTIVSPGFAGSGLGRLAVLQRLRRLTLYRCRVSIEMLDSISKLRTLEAIRLGGCEIASKEKIRALAKMPNLHEIDLDFSDVGDSDIEQLLRSPVLTTLYLCDCRNITDQLIEAVNKTANLETFHIAKCAGITDAGMRRLRTFPRLKELQVSEGQYSAETLELLKKRVDYLWVQ